MTVDCLLYHISMFLQLIPFEIHVEFLFPLMLFDKKEIRNHIFCTLASGFWSLG